MRKQKAPKCKGTIILIISIVIAFLVSIILVVGDKESAGTISYNDSATAMAETTPCVQLSNLKTDTPHIPITTTAKPIYKSCGVFTLTAYCPCVECCGEWSAEHYSRIGTDYIQKTASGTIPTAGRTIGVDPEVIPFGTTVFINGHAYIAEDSSGAINGNTIDVFFNTHDEALEFGRQTAEVYIKND